MMTIGSYEAKTHLPRLLGRVAKGERITITKHGVPIAMLVPVLRERKDDIQLTIRRLLELRSKHRLRGLKIRDLIEEGRR